MATLLRTSNLGLINITTLIMLDSYIKLIAETTSRILFSSVIKESVLSKARNNPEIVLKGGHKIGI